jgi:MFS family permease
MIARRFPAFQYADYRHLFLYAFFTTASRWALMLARAWLVFELTDSSLAVGLVTFAGMSQFIIIGPVAGVIADRFDRRRLALVAVFLMMASSAGLAALVIADVVAVWQVVLLAIVYGMAMALAGPAVQALIPNLVPPEHLLNAVALSGISQHGSRIVGPLLGGVLLATLGAGFVFIAATLILVFALFQLLQIRHRQIPIPRATSGSLSPGDVLGDIRGGFQHLRGDTRIFAIIGCVAFHCAFTMAYESLLPRLADGLGGGSNTFSAIVMGVGAGAITGALGVSFIRQKARQGPVMALTGIGSGLAMVVLGTATVPAVAVLGAFLAGATQASYMTISNTLVQQVVPDRLRGRVMSIFAMLAAGFMAFMNLGFGWLADTVGIRPLMLIPGIAWIVIFALAAVFLTEIRHVLRVGDFRPRAAAAAVAP